MTVRDEAGRQNLAHRITWARAKAELLDPTTNPTLLAGVEFAIAPELEDIEPLWASGARPHRTPRTVTSKPAVSTTASAPTTHLISRHACPRTRRGDRTGSARARACAGAAG
jgi:hypothetical protein